MEKQQKDTEKNNDKKIIIMIIILIIIILSLITSCSCSIGFWGKLGDYFKREEIIPVTPGKDDKETIKNKNLKFDVEEYRMSLGDGKGKISYKIDGFIPTNAITCTTSDASIATCYVVDGYVVILPKKEGEVEVTIKAEANDKIYEATTKVIITEDKKYIELSSTRGTIDLKYTNIKEIYYSLVGLQGTVNISVSDSKIATAIAKGGKVIITAKKEGTVVVTVSLDYNGKTYTNTYTLTIKDSTKTNPDNPDQPVVKKESYLEGLTVSIGELTPKFNKNIFEYEVIVKSTDDKISVYPEKDKDSRLSYIIDGKTVKSLKDIDLPYGSTKVTIITANTDGNKNEYIVTVYRPKEVSDDYFVSSPLTKYDMVLSDGQSTRTIILNTNVFAQKVTVQEINNGIRIISNEDKTLYIDITTNSDAISKIEYNADEIGPTSLPIVITANKEGTAIINVSLNANGKEISNIDIELNIHRKFTLTLNANGGLFNEMTKEYKFILGDDDYVDLSEYDIPYKLDDTDSCLVFKFKGYSLTSAGTIKYTVDDVKNLKLYGKDLATDLTLYAIYESESVEKDQVIEKTIYITDIPLFKNDYYFNKYGEDKVIYPGAYGSYVAYIDNQTEDDIIITGITLKEETICSDIGCLNMGYLIKHGDEGYYYMGKYVDGQNDIYEILNDSNTINTNKTTKVIDIEAKNETITIKPGKTKAISFFWKWVEVDNKVDTSIGNIASNANDKYHLTIGLNYKTTEKVCTKD